MNQASPSSALPLTAATGVSCLGNGRAATAASLRAGRSGLVPNDFADTGAALPSFIGPVAGLDAVAFPAELRLFDCRNNRLALLALQQDGFFDAVAQTRARVGAHRIGVFLGTSTGGILDTEEMFRYGRTHELEPERYNKRHRIDSLPRFVCELLGLKGPAFVVATACSSSAKVFANAARYIAAGLCDAALVGGVDSLCFSTLYGFSSLELLSNTPCTPFGAARKGISIGEAAAFALLEPKRDARTALLGYGESSDGYHMSSPHPEGLGARLAMQQALDTAGLRAEQIDYLNLHGTGTPANDSVESLAVKELFAHDMLSSSTKGATGHTLGAAGALEALISDLALEHQFAPGTIGTAQLDDALTLKPLLQGHTAQIARVMSNSFGFGGSNCSLVFGAL